MTIRSLVLALGAASALWLSAPAAAAGSPRPMAITDLLTLKRVGAPAVSPDGRWVVWQQTDTDPQTYARRTGLWRTRTSGGAAELIVASGNSPAFSPDGSRLYFLAAAGASDQLWTLDLAKPGAAPVQASHFAAEVAGFKLSPDGHRVLVWGDAPRNCPTLGCPDSANPGQPGPGSGRFYGDGSGFIRHWDSWKVPGTLSRGFVAAIDDKGMVTDDAVAIDGPEGTLSGDTPSKPMGGGDELAWAADSRSVFFAARQADRHEPNSTNLDIWQSRLDGTAPINLTAANLATDTAPAPSPDGKWLAWLAMARPAYEADRQVIQLLNLATGERRSLSQGWDRSVGSLAWAPDSRALIVTAEDVLDTPAFRIDIATGKPERLSLAPKGLSEGNIGAITPMKNGAVLFTRDAVANPAEVYLAAAGQPARALSHANDAQLGALVPVRSTRFHFAGAGGDVVWGQIHKPAGATGKLPVLFFVHGGPQGSFNDSWSFRWNPRLFAAQGYAVVSVDFHGSTGYGQAFTNAIRGDWGGKPLEDLQKGLAAALASDPQLDGANACALGASYGGYMMNWIAGMWPDRFKCLVQHDGVFDARAMAYETEELWFDEWEHGGHPYYEAPEAFEHWNPVNHVAAWKSPMLVITSERDFRIPYTQGIAAFAALQRRGIPSELLVFPDENHWVLKPKNSLQWHQTVFAWLARWLGR